MNSKYGGQLIYATRDEYGPIEVIEIKQKLRSLHFGNKTQQASMFLYNPVLLMHKYTQAMLTPLCWNVPEKVLVLGVGGGSIPKYLLHYFPRVEIDAVELRPEVSRIAREYFSMELNKRLQIHHDNAENFIDKSCQESRYDLILVDLFLTAKDKDISVDISEQFSKLRKLLSSEGTLTMNIIGNTIDKYSGLTALHEVFDGNLYSMAVDKSNIILLASNGEIVHEDTIDFTTVEKKLSLPFRQYFHKMNTVNI